MVAFMLTLPHGVMAALQILVLSVQVRVLMRQQILALYNIHNIIYQQKIFWDYISKEYN